MGCRTVKHGNMKILRIVGAVLITAGIVCGAALAGIEAFIRPTLMKLLDYKCNMSAERVISKAVFDRFSDAEGCEGLVKLTFDKDGRIAALETDRAKINSMKALLSEAVNEGLDSLSEEEVGISVGTLTGISVLYGTGAMLSFRLEPRGKAETRLVSSFKTSGINQTIHSIILNVETELSPMMPGFTETVNVSFDILLAQTVIVGSVPDSYSNIILDEENRTELADFDI
ncbi:MAG: sporulation protein YunB [Ruminiclostridium sp.]|nr:sporulation protein YunB [Ruminiclostridium sp.]